MKNCIWLQLVVLLLAQSFTAQASNNNHVRCYDLPFINGHAAHLDSKLLLRFYSLTIKPTATGILLNWKVEETTNLQYFLIEHSMDGQHFLPLFEVPVRPGQQTYSFIDDGFKAYDKTVYYRVKAIYPMVVVESPVRKLTSQAN